MKEKAKPNRSINYVGSLAAAGLMLFLINKIPDWNFSFVRDNYRDILLAVNLSLGIQAVFSFVLIFYHPLFQHHLANFVISAVSIFALSVILHVFPVDFSIVTGEWLNILFRILLIVSITGSAISVIFHLINFFIALRSQIEAGH